LTAININTTLEIMGVYKMYKKKIIEAMKKVFKNVPYGIDHTLQVLNNAEVIMTDEDISDTEKELISIIAILHDIGAVEAQNKYGSMEGSYQEKEGPAVARAILEQVDYDAARIERVCYVIGNHHTPSKIDGLDFQIQWEADLLENFTYMDISKDEKELKEYINSNFKTAAGRNLAYKRLEIK
jgi:HD superfamily phosphodiesterase